MPPHGKICIIFSDIQNDHNDGYVLGIQKQANAYGYRTFTFSMPQLSELYGNGEEYVFDLIDFDMYDGVIFSERSFAAHRSLVLPIEEALRKKCHCPIVVIGASQTIPNAVWMNSQPKFEQIAEHLIEVHGCRRIFCLGGEKNIADERIDGFVNVMRRNGLPCGPDNILYGGYWIQGAETLAKDIAYDVVEKPDAVMCLNDEIAYALIKNLFRFGLRVPEDILVTGFDASAYASNDAISITTFPADTLECGRRAAALLHALITDTEPDVIVPRPLSLQTGTSCGCGENRKINVRAKLDELQKNEVADMEFRNSLLEEKLYKIRSISEFSQVIKNHKYLIRDQVSVGVNLMERGDEMARCVYLKDYLINGDSVKFRAKNIYPDLFTFGAIQNVHILPLVFDKKYYGYMTMGYAEENVFTAIAKKFAKHLAIGLEILSLRQSAETTERTQTDTANKAEAISVEKHEKPAKSSGAIFVYKDGTMRKVQLEQVLYFESNSKKVYAALRSGKYEVKQRLHEIEELVADKHFFRVSKSVLANLDRVIGYKAGVDRTLSAMLDNKESIRVSRNYTEEFKKQLEEN